MHRLLDEEARRTRRPFKQVVNDAIRRGLAPRRSGASKVKLLVSDSALRRGYVAESFNALADELEDDDVLAKGRL